MGLTLPGCATFSFQPEHLPHTAYNLLAGQIDNHAERGSRSLPKLDRPLLSIWHLTVSSSGRIRLRPAPKSSGAPPLTSGRGASSSFSCRVRRDEIYFELKFRF